MNKGENNFAYQEGIDENKVRGNFVSAFFSFCIFIRTYAFFLWAYFLLMKKNEDVEISYMWNALRSYKTMHSIPNLYFFLLEENQGAQNLGMFKTK